MALEVARARGKRRMLVVVSRMLRPCWIGQSRLSVLVDALDEVVGGGLL